MIAVTTDVFCDIPNCCSWEHGVTGPRSDARAARAHVQRNHGWWRTSQGKDVCPMCVRHVSTGVITARAP